MNLNIKFILIQYLDKNAYSTYLYSKTIKSGIKVKN